MRRRVGAGLIIAGIALVMGALSFYLYHLWLEEKAGEAAAKVLSLLKEEIAEGSGASDAEDSEDGDAAAADNISDELHTVTIDGYDYIGYLSVPELELELPVMAQYSMEGLEIAPGVYSGSLPADDLVIAGHNYRRHFSPLKWAEVGTEVIFTDMDGGEYVYEITEVLTLKPTQVDTLIGKSEDDAWDLTLFTCNTGGTTRCVVRCVRK